MTRNFSRNGTILKVFFGVATLGVLVGAWFVLSYRTFQQVEAVVMPRACLPVIGLPGTEDMALDPKSGRVFISSLDRRRQARGDETRGRIALFDPADPLSTSWRDRTNGVPRDFSPIGISFYQSAGIRRLFVVNDTPASVLLYNVSVAGDLTFLREFKDQRLSSPNSVVAVGPSSFYVTNDVSGGHAALLGKLQFFLKLKTGAIYFFDGKSWSVEATGLGFANGIEKSPDGSKIYVAETSAARISSFARDLVTGHLELIGRQKLDTFPDNLSVTQDGSLLYAAHPRPLLLPATLTDRQAQAPSEFGRVPAIGTGGPSRLWVNDGSDLSGSTVALEVGSKLLIGALYEDKFLLCD